MKKTNIEKLVENMVCEEIKKVSDEDYVLAGQENPGENHLASGMTKDFGAIRAPEYY